MKRYNLRNVHGHRNHRRRGGAIVEFAVVLPLLLTILFGIVEFGYVFLVRQSLQHAAREGCRLASLKTSVAPYANVITRVKEIMGAANVPIDPVSVTQGPCEEIVQVTVPYDSVSLFGGFLGVGDFTLTGRCTMRKEGCTLPGGP